MGDAAAQPDAARPGLISAFRFDAKGGGRPADWAELDADPMGSNVHGDLWVHLNRTASGVQRWLSDTARLPEHAIEQLLTEDPRPKFVHFPAGEIHPEGFVLILRAVNLNPDADPENMVAIRLWVDANRVISLRGRKLMAEDALDRAFREGRGPLNAPDLIAHLAGAMLDRIDAVVDELEAALEEAEERVESSGEEIGAVRRSAVRLRRYLGPQRDVLLRAGSDWPAWVGKRERNRLRSRAERVARVVEDIEELIARSGFAQEERHARLAERMNRSNVALTIVATVFLPMGLVASIWGMNTERLPFAEHPHGFWIVNALIALTGVGLALFAWRMSRIS